MSFVFSRFDLVNILDFVGVNPSVKECEFQCNELIFSEEKYHANKYYQGTKTIPPSTAVLIYDKNEFTGNEVEHNPLANFKQLRVSTTFNLVAYERINQVKIFRHAIQFRNNYD